MRLTQEQEELRRELIKHGADRWLFDIWGHYLIDYSFDKVLSYVKSTNRYILQKKVPLDNFIFSGYPFI